MSIKTKSFSEDYEIYLKESLKREEGYYWVKFDDQWTIGYYGYLNQPSWRLLFITGTYYDQYHIKEVRESRIEF